MKNIGKVLLTILFLNMMLMMMLTTVTQASGLGIVGFSDLATGDVKSGIFTVHGVVVDSTSVSQVALRVGDKGPWEMMSGINNWIYTIDTSQIVIGVEHRLDSETGRVTNIYHRGQYYGNLNITACAFDSNGVEVDEKTVTVTIVPETPYTNIGSGIYTKPIAVTLKAKPDVSIFYTTDGSDPTTNGILYSSALNIAQTTVITAVAKSSSGLYSAPFVLNLKISSVPTSYTIQYYQDKAMTVPLPDLPYLKAGTYYLKVVTNNDFTSGPFLTITAPGNNNNLNQVNMIKLENCIFYYPRVITADTAATGSIQENIQINGTNSSGNQITNLTPANAVTKAAYLKTQPPSTGSIALQGGGATTNDPMPYFTIQSTSATQMRLALSENGLATATWINYATLYKGFDISTGGIGTKIVWIEFKDQAGNVQTQHTSTTVSYGTSSLMYNIEYFQDQTLTKSLGTNPILGVGTYYLKITANQALGSSPMVSIDAEGTTNDVTSAAVSKVTNRVYYYTRIIAADPAAIGSVKESITISGKAPANPENSAYTLAAQYTMTVTNNGNGSTTPGNAITVTNGVSTTITATPDTGYQFVNWTQTGGTGTATFANSSSPNTTVSITGGDVTIQANFTAIQYTLTINNSGKGSTTPSGGIAVNYGANTTIAATPNTGYQFVNWTQTGGAGTATFANSSSTNTTVSITGGDVTIQANFTAIQYTLTINNSGNGNTTPSGGITVNYDVNTSITATPNIGCLFVNWIQTGGNGTATFANPNLANTTVTIIGGNVTIQANFAVAQYTLTVTKSGNVGSTTPSGGIMVNYGVNTTITATPNTGYQFVNWIQTGGAGTAVFANSNSSNTTVTVTGGNVIIQANFAAIQYSLTVTNDGNGSTNPSGGVTVNSGINTTITATPNTGYQFVNWTQTGGTGTATFSNANSASTTVSVIGGNATIQANFAAIPQYTLSIIDNWNGTDSPANSITVTNGVGTLITATPNVGYQFVNWTQTGGTGIVIFADANSENTTVTVINGNATIQANFILNLYSLTVTNNGNGRTYPSSAGAFYGVGVTISASPNIGFHFVNWSQIGGTGIATFANANSDDTTVSVTGGDVTIQANFVGDSLWSEKMVPGKMGYNQWQCITSSSDGTKLAAGVAGGYIYTSTDSGVTWKAQTNAGSRNWKSIASSLDGTKLAAGDGSGYIYTSTDSGVTWKAQTNAGSRSWQSITSSSDGTKLAAVVWVGYIYTSTDSGASWTVQTNAGSRWWLSITSSADGSKLAAVESGGGNIYTSTDSGATWTAQANAGSRYWHSITSSLDGTKLAAGDGSGYIYTSIDGGVTWTAQTNAGSRNWQSITSSSDGTKLAAVINSGNIYTSTDSGATWTEQTNAGSKGWWSITSSSDGTKLAAIVNGDYIYTSTDSGATWTAQTNAGSRRWQSITSSSNGTKLAAVVWGGYIYTSTDNGSTWTEQTNLGNRNWNYITCSVDGTKLAVVDAGGYIYTSTDSGISWTPKTNAGSRNWRCIISSADGSKLVAGVNGGYIYTSTDSGATWTEQTSAGSRNWFSITSSSDGAKLAIVDENNGYIYTSTDSGVNWIPQTKAGKGYWRSITSSGDGTKLAAVTGMGIGNIYTSTDSGETWTAQNNAGSRVWFSITSSLDGTKLAAVDEFEGYIYTSTDGGLTWKPQISAGCRNWNCITSSSDGAELAAGADEPNIYTIDTSLSQCPTPVFKRMGGTFTEAQNVSITAYPSDAVIRYTTDGSTPTESHGTIYTGPISINSTTTLKAIAYRSGYVDSTVVTAIYNINQ